MFPQNPKKLFISHSSQDADWCRRFVAVLRGAGYTCFYDEDSIPGTSAWVRMIEQGVGDCDCFILVLTPRSWASRWVGEEVQLALVKNKHILVIVHEPTQVDGLLLTRQWVQAIGLTPDDAANKVLHTFSPGGVATPPPKVERSQSQEQHPAWDQIAIPARLDGLGFQGWRDRKTGVSFIIPPVCSVPASKFTMGSAQDDPQAYDDEKPQYSVFVGDFEIGAYPVTVAEYALAVQAGAVPAPHDYTWPEDDWVPQVVRGTTMNWATQQQRPDHPVVCVTWKEATAYAQWLAQVTGQPWRLPTEAEWEKAARGTDGRVYPWDNEWDKLRANTRDGGPNETTPVGAYAAKGDASPYGCHDMAGNVWEWTHTAWYDRPPYDLNKYENDSDKRRVLRGGSWSYSPRLARAAVRIRSVWYSWDGSGGFRLARGRVGW